MNVTQVIAGQSTTLTISIDADGDPTDQGTGTLTLTDWDGTAVGTPIALTPGSDPGVYTVTAPPVADPTVLLATISFPSVDLTIAHGAIEVVGGVLFTERQARGFSDGRLADTSKYTDAEISAERARITDFLEAETGQGWIPRWRRLTFRGGRSSVLAVTAVRSEGVSGGEGAGRHISQVVAAANSSGAITGVETDGTRLEHPAFATAGLFTVDVIYGRPHISDGVDRIALLELVDRLPASRIPRSAVRAQDELATVGWEPQNNGRPSRVPDVNAWLRTRDLREWIA